MDLLSFSKLCMLLAVAIASLQADAAPKASLATLPPAPAPAPAPSFENITQSLTYGGEYSTFIQLLVETKLDVAFQAIANDTEGPGLTIFAPTDAAFKLAPASSLLQNITESNKTRLIEYHVLTKFQAYKDLQRSNNNVTSTYATDQNGGQGYKVNITFTGGGQIQIKSDWTTAFYRTTVYTSSPASIFAISQVLIPDEIFGLPPPPPPPSPPPPPAPKAPAPAPSTLSSPSKVPASKESSFSSPLFIPYFSSLLASLLLLLFLIISAP
ncbi:hypothetical protein KP509_28G027000 [Ceratopteris richardii]|uniref:FAS1 domain-containing protein n=1 Tax=Ceratopteris richardii TaxID=49495 RepID=A0A8T2RAN2_CERRI|nr:hypothetical protein KP509_28G027000 [Ceratopteris richardii]